MISSRVCRRFWMLGLCVLGASLLLASAFAQSQAAPAQPRGRGQFITSQTADDENIAAAEQEDENAVYKESPSVRAVGKLLHLSPRASSSVFEYFNFLILAGAVLFGLVKYVPQMFRDRQKKIDQQLVDARTATDEANERLKVVEERLGRLDQEIDELRKRAEHEGVADEHRIKQSIEEERRKIVAAAEQEISAASAVAARSLRKFAAELAMDRVLGKMQLTENQDRVLMNDFASGLEATELQERRN